MAKGTAPEADGIEAAGLGQGFLMQLKRALSSGATPVTNH
jgi:hypothetical protein